MGFIKTLQEFRIAPTAPTAPIQHLQHLFNTCSIYSIYSTCSSKIRCGDPALIRLYLGTTYRTT